MAQTYSKNEHKENLKKKEKKEKKKSEYETKM